MTAPRWTPAELETLVAIVTDPNPDHQQQRLHEAFGDSSGRATDRLIEASVAVDRLRHGQPVDLGDGTVFGRDCGMVLRPEGTRFTEATALEQFIGQLASLESTTTADLLLSEAVAELGADHLLGPCQRLLDKLRDDYHAGPDRQAEPIGEDLWRIGDGVVRLLEAARSHHARAYGAARLRASLTGCVRVGRLWIDPPLANLPDPLGEVATEIAQDQPLVLSCTPGRLHLDGDPWPLRPGGRGRTALDVTLLAARGRHADIGVLVEVADPNDVEALAHELIHAGGGRSETLTHRLGHDLARWATASGW